MLGETLPELELLRAWYEMAVQTGRDELRFHRALSDLLGLTQAESSLRHARGVIKVGRLADHEDILAEVRRLKALDAKSQE